jgi:hypothetical protein
MSRPNTIWTINSFDHTATAWRIDQPQRDQEAIEVTLNESDLEEIQRAIARTYPPESEAEQ